MRKFVAFADEVQWAGKAARMAVVEANVVVAVVAADDDIGIRVPTFAASATEISSGRLDASSKRRRTSLSGVSCSTASKRSFRNPAALPLSCHALADATAVAIAPATASG